MAGIFEDAKIGIVPVQRQAIDRRWRASSFLRKQPETDGANSRAITRLFAQDPQLRSFIIKAEKFHVLVAEGDASRFIEMMQRLGYLIG